MEMSASDVNYGFLRIFKSHVYVQCRILLLIIVDRCGHVGIKELTVVTRASKRESKLN